MNQSFMNQEEFDNLFTCKICLDTLLIPVRLKFSCCTGHDSTKCDYALCLQCARSYFELNKPRNKRKSAVYCLNCRKTCLNPRELNATRVYEKDILLMRILNTLGKSWSCRNAPCTFSHDSQIEIERHINKDCPFSMVKCRWIRCTVRALRKDITEHERACRYAEFDCPVCQKSFPVSALELHYKQHEKDFLELQQTFHYFTHN